MEHIRIGTEVYNEVLEHLGNHRKIKAIKTVRVDSNCGLKEAKLAIERLAYERNILNSDGNLPGTPHPDALKICSGPLIKKVVIDFGTGDLEVDLEGLQLVALMEMQKVGLDTCREILDLVDVLTAISEGRRVSIEEEQDEEG